MKTRFLSIFSAFALAVCSMAQPFVKNTVTTNEVVSGVLTPTHNLVTVKTNFTVTGTQNVNNLQASTLTITNDWNAIGATNMLMANMRNSTNTSLTIGVSNVYATGEASWPTGHVAYLFATNANYGSANVTNLYTLLTNATILATDGNGKLISTNIISASQLTSGTNLASVGFSRLSLSNSTTATTLDILRTNGVSNPPNSEAVLVRGNLAGTDVFGHAFADQTSLDSENTGAYASYDAVSTLTGDTYYNHYGAFQGRQTFSGSVGMDLMWTFGSAPVLNNSQPLNSLRHITISDPTGSGGVTNQTGLYIESMVQATNNYSIYSAGGQGYHDGLWTARSGLATSYGVTATNYIAQNSDSAASMEAVTIRTAFAANDARKTIVWRDAALPLGQIDVSFPNGATDSVMSFGHLYNGGYTASDVMTIRGTGNVGIGTNTPAAKLHVAGGILGSNLTFTHPRWVDANFSGLNFGSNPSANPPSRVEVEGGTGIYGLAWEHGDNASFSAEVQHGVASTNANFPDFYYEPHLHVSANSVPTDTSNVTFKITFQVSNVSGTYSNTIVTLTNTVSFTYPSQHKMLDFGEITNNLLSGADALIFRGTVTRLATNELGVFPGDIGSGAIVFIDTFGFHIPANEYGSALINGDATP